MTWISWIDHLVYAVYAVHLWLHHTANWHLIVVMYFSRFLLRTLVARRAFLYEPVSRVPVHVMRVVQFVQTLWSSHICTIYWIAFKISQELKSATRFTRSFPTTRAVVQSQLSGQTSFKEPGYFCPSLVRHGQRSEPIACTNLYYLQIS